MPKVVNYLYPKHELASNLKVFQDKTNQIKAFYFTRDYIKEVERLESGTNYAVYFLFDKTDNDDLTKVYIGQSKNGALRMQDHNNRKMFWSFSLMFVTDNNSFDALTIDYLEYHFIQKLEKSGRYTLDNKVIRKTEPNVSIYDKPTILTYIAQIEFLLKAEGINIEEQKSDVYTKFYHPKNKRYDARIFVKDGGFILSAGSIVRRPVETSENWADGGSFYNRYSTYINEFLSDGKIVKDNDNYRTLVNLTFSSPSGVASLISGLAEYGWMFFEELDDLRR